MPKWPIRVKLIAGLSLVVGMMLTLMGGSIFGLPLVPHQQPVARRSAPRAWGASMDLLEEVVGLELSNTGTPEGDEALEKKVRQARGGAGRLLQGAEEEHDPGAIGPTTAATSWGLGVRHRQRT